MRATLHLFPVPALTLLAAACGNAPATPAAASSTAQSSQMALADQAAACLRSHGLSMPDPATGPNGQPKWDFGAVTSAPQRVPQAALQACRSQLVAARVPGVGANPAAATAGAKYAACMRQHGLPGFPDPDPTTGSFTGRSSLEGNGIDTRSPLFQAANTARKTQLAQRHAAIGAGG